MTARTLVCDRVAGVRVDGPDVVVDLEAVEAVELPSTPGLLTGRPLAEQGVETTMPNLPHLDLPRLEPVAYRLRVTCPAPDVVRLTLAPAGHRVLADDGTGLGIVVDPAPDPQPLRVDDSDTAGVDAGGWTTLAAGDVAVRLRHQPSFALEVRDRCTGDVVLRSAHRLRQVAGFPTAPTVVVQDGRTTLNLELAAEEEVLGFGEQFGRLVKNGQRLVLRVEDALGTGTGRAYKPVPVWHSRGESARERTGTGYTAFLNTGAVTTADVGHSRPAVLSLTADDDALDLYVVLGPDPAGRLRSYTALTGRAVVPPPWAFGYWMGRCRYHSAQEMLEVADTMRAHDVPLDVLHLDPDWLVVDRLNCDFIWNEARFGPRKQFVEDLADRGVRLSVWELPYLDPASPRYAEAEAAGYLVQKATGGTAFVTRTPTPDGRPRALLDFTNPAARAWWQALHQPFLDDGVAVFKTDFGEGLPEGAVAADDTPPGHLHNLYPLKYNGAVSEAVARYTGRAPLVWGRSGWAGSQRFPGQWGGDAESTVAGMRATVRGGLSYALSAPGLWSHDIGGFFGPELTPGLYVRWTQFGALSPLMRAHGLRPREPWEFGTEALRIARDWVRLRYRLLPYLWQTAQQCARDGLPMMRPLALAFPDDPVAAARDGEYLLGDDLLVVPVYDDGVAPVRRRWWVPEGRWTDLVTGEAFAGQGFVSREVPLENMPVLVRDGAVLPMVDVRDGDRSTDDVLGREWVLHRFGPPPTDATRIDLVGFDGTTTTATVRGDGVVTGNGRQGIGAEVVIHP